jgi:autotransporter-associated beta strand protein
MTFRPYLVASLVAASLSAPSWTQAADATWFVNSGTWATGANWTPATAPGATTGNTNTDTATFLDNATGALRTIAVDAGRNVQNIVINQSTSIVSPATGAYSFSSGSLVLTSGGSITYNNNVVGGVTSRAIFNQPITLGGASGGTYAFTSNRSSTNAGGLVLNGSAPISGQATAGNTMTLTLNGNSTAFNTSNANSVRGVISDGAAGGKVALTKDGAGTWMLFGNQTYTGATTVNAGTLIIYGSTAAASAVTVNSGATFTGTGTVNGSTTLTDGSHLQAGIGTGTVATFNLASLNTADGAIMDIEFGVNTNDRIAVSGQLSLSGTTDINLYALGTTNPFLTEGTYTIITAGSITGFSASSFSVANAQSGFTYNFNNTGTAITLDVVPEPSTYALLGLGLAAVLWRARRLRRA